MLSQFSLPKDQRQKLTQILRQQREPPCIQHFDIKCKKMILSSSHNYDNHEVRYVRSYGNHAVYSDAMCFENEIDYYEKDSQNINKILTMIEQQMIKQQNKKRELDAKALQDFKRQVFVWFYQESLRPKPQQPTTKRTFLRPMITIKSDQKEGIQVHGTILTKDGYKITYPNIMGIIKMSSLWQEPNKTIVQKSFYQLKVSNHLTLQDDMDDLNNYVWKIKVFHSFFKILLKISIGNLEIKDVLVKVADKLKTTINHTFLFYQISSKPWGIPGMIKDLNKKLFLRERQDMQEGMLSNINDDLNELFRQLQIQNQSLIPYQQIHVSFKEYVNQLQYMMQKRVNS